MNNKGNCGLRNGFTIVELMVSIALVLILMLGISQVFRITSSTVAGGQAISDNVRVARAAQATFARDFGGAVTVDAPFISIHSSVMPAFRNRQDELSDLKQTQFKNRDQLTVDLDGDNIEGEDTVLGEKIAVAQYGSRIHRTDILTFFIRDLIKRQTGNPGQNMISPMTGQEAWVRYCHGQVWDGKTALPGAGGFYPPGPGNTGSVTFDLNPNNLYGSQFLLTRQAILLREPDATGVIADQFGASQSYWTRPIGDGVSSLRPLDDDTRLTTDTNVRVQQAFVDLAGITIDGMRQVMTNYMTDPSVTAQDKNRWTGEMAWRPCVNPLMPQPITTETLAQTATAFVPGCSQFIVEYAGDFIAQNNIITDPNYGNTTFTYLDPEGTDGVIDYVLIGTPGNYRREIRWYGLPRRTHDTFDLTGKPAIIGSAATGTAARTMVDVVPFRDVLVNSPSAAAGSFSTGAPFEKNKPPLGSGLITSKVNYLDTSGTGTNGMGLGDQYVCGWTPLDPVKPKLIRITLVIDDPAGRLAEGQTFEYVFELP